MLELSSCLFATVVLHAYQRGCDYYHHLYLLLLTTSLVYRVRPHCPYAFWADVAVAHWAFLSCVWDFEWMRRLGEEWLLVWPMLIMLVWWFDTTVRTHAALHVVTTVGMHCWLAYLY